MAYTTINKHTEHFNTKLYTGANKSVTGVGFQPDWVWIKERDAGYHAIFDAVRGVTKIISSNANSAESTASDTLTAFGADGFTLGADSSNYVGGSSQATVSWNWKAGTTSGISTNGDTTITPSSYSFNQTSGFSVLTYTGNGTSGAGVAHGLGAKPKWYMVKRTDTTGSWQVYTQPDINTSNATKYLRLNATDAEATNNNRWNGWQPDTTNFYLGNSTEVNASSGTYVAYVFAEKQGYSRIGKYTGNGNADGTFVYTGFKPAWLIVKQTNTSGEGWYMWDNKRSSSGGANENDRYLIASASSAEGTLGVDCDFLSNGFKHRYTGSASNGSGATYIYMAFGQSLVGSNNVPCTAR